MPGFHGAFPDYFLSVAGQVHVTNGGCIGVLIATKLSFLWGVLFPSCCWDKMSQLKLLLRMIQLSSIQTKSEISKYKEFGGCDI